MIIYRQRRDWQGGQKQSKITSYTDRGETDRVDRKRARRLHIQTEERLTEWTEAGQDDCIYTEERLTGWTETGYRQRRD